MGEKGEKEGEEEEERRLVVGQVVDCVVKKMAKKGGAVTLSTNPKEVGDAQVNRYFFI